MVRIASCPRQSFVPRSGTGSGSLWRMRVLCVLFASSLLIFTAIMPGAARRMPTSSFATTESATSFPGLGRRVSCVLEKRGILGDSKKPGRRPGDITFPCWQDSKGLAVDVCVTSPFSGRNLHSPSPAEDYGHRKHRKYDGGFVHTAYRFCALALETTGGVSEEALSFLQQLWRFAARQQGAKLCV